MNKVILKLEARKEKVLSSEIERLEKEYHNTDLDYRDSGKGWYFNKMQRIERELAELIAYRDKEVLIKQAQYDIFKQKKDIEEKLGELRSKVLYLLCDLRDIGINYYSMTRLEEFLDKFKL